MNSPIYILKPQIEYYKQFIYIYINVKINVQYREQIRIILIRKLLMNNCSKVCLAVQGRKS